MTTLLQFEALWQRIETTLNQVLCNALPDHQAAFQTLTAAFPTAGLTLKDASTIQQQAYTDTDKANLDEGLRHYMMRLITQAAAASQPLMVFKLPGQTPEQTPALPRLFQLAWWMCEAEVVDAAGAPSAVRLLDLAHYCRLLEEVFESGTIQDGLNVFAAFLDNHQLEEKLRDTTVTAGYKLCVLRCCNNLLKRLSKAQDLVMCGRILVFVARIYTLTDKSGTNSSGLVNSELQLLLDEVGPDACDSTGEPVDAKLYATFWGLQTVFKNPGTAFQASVWAKTCADLTAVLDQLDACKVTVKAGPSVGEADTDTDSTTVRYLSSSKLFGLQLRDASFRRQFLVQVAVLLHHLRHPGKGDKQQPGTKHEGLEDMMNRVYKSLAATEENGPQFVAAVQHVLSREGHWVEWKNSGCPSFEKPPAPAFKPPQALGAAAGAAGDGPAVKRRRIAPAGAGRAAATQAALLRNVVVPVDQMAGLKADDRRVADKPLIPTLEEYVTPVLVDLDPENDIEPQYHQLRADKVFAWKVVRAISKVHLEHLHYEQTKGKPDPVGEINKALLASFPAHRERFEAYRAKQAAERAAAEAAEAAEAAAAAAGEGEVEAAEELKAATAPAGLPEAETSTVGDGTVTEVTAQDE